MTFTEFESWFKQSFNISVPEGYRFVVAEHPSGIVGETAQLYALADVEAFTDERDLFDKGVCLIGDAESLTHILLRVSDGKVFVVDRTDYKVVDATFRDTVSLANLLDLDY